MISFVLALTLAAATPPPMQDVLRTVFSLHGFSDPNLNPRGDALVWQESGIAENAGRPEMRTQLFIEKIGSAAVRLTAGDGKAFYDESNPVWSPDGRNVAFFSDAASRGQAQIYLAPVYGSGVKQLTHLTGAAQAMRWSPDGKQIAILYIAHPHRRSGAQAAGARKVGVIGSVTDEQQLAIVDAATGNVREITPSNAYVYEYGWAPDSKHLTFTYAYGNGDNNWWIAKLATVDTSGHMHTLYAPPFQMNAPHWSPDGKSIAVIGGLMSDFGPVGGDVYLVDVKSGKARDITPGMNLSAASIDWVGSSRMYMVAHAQGSMHLYALNVRTGTRTQLTTGDESLRGLSTTPSGSRIALIRTSFARPTEIWMGTPKTLRRITHENARVPNLNGVARSLHWRDGAYNVQGWLIAPRAYDPHKRYPLVTIIHGGPSSESTPSYDSQFVSALTLNGYFVLEPNPRGSFGQGESFTRANVKDFGYGDWRDDLKGMDAAIASAPIDPKRLGLFGWSYGGYMGMWAETQTRRLKAIVAGAGVADWQSYYGQNGIDQWMIPFFGKSVYDDPTVYAKSSPMTFIKNSHTPVLILQGERDEEVPAPQAFEFYNAMQALHVPSQLMVYADEGHSPRKPTDQIDVLTRLVNWFTQYLR